MRSLGQSDVGAAHAAERPALPPRMLQGFKRGGPCKAAYFDAIGQPSLSSEVQRTGQEGEAKGWIVGGSGCMMQGGSLRFAL